jgi:hypothetical protein
MITDCSQNSTANEQEQRNCDADFKQRSEHEEESLCQNISMANKKKEGKKIFTKFFKQKC